MAKIGLKRPVYAILTEGTTDTYANGGTIGKAITANISMKKGDVKLWADDAVAESDSSVSGGTIALTVDELSPEVQKALLGHKIDETSKEMTANAKDIAPYVGFGFYGAKKVNNVRKYRAIWLLKVQFSEPNDENKTGEETKTFNTASIEGLIMTNRKEDWKVEKTFDTEAEAETWLLGKAAIAQV